MVNRVVLFFSLLLLILISPVQGSAEKPLVRYFSNPLPYNEFTTNITLQGQLLHIAKFKYWLNEISKIPIGMQTLQDIIKSGHTLTILNNKHARISAGRTRAPMTMDLINGTGADVEILFDATITEAGSHMVYNSRKILVEFTAVENLFHELVHAKHKMRGTWRYFDSEGQAIEEENVFREQYAQSRGKIPTERAYVTGVPIESIDGVEPSEEHTYLVRANQWRPRPSM